MTKIFSLSNRIIPPKTKNCEKYYIWRHYYNVKRMSIRAVGLSAIYTILNLLQSHIPGEQGQDRRLTMTTDPIIVFGQLILLFLGL
jgi:hypothetical protein